MAELNGLSHSTVETYQQCPQKYRLRKVLRVNEIPGWSLVGGNAVHTATAVLDLADFGVPSEGPTTFMEAFEEEIASQLERSGIPEEEWHRAGKVSKDKPNKEDRKWWEENGQLMVDNWRNFLARTNHQIWIMPNGDPAVEVEIKLEEDQGFGRQKITAYIDRIFESPEKLLGVVDLKGGSRTPASIKQLGEYRLLLGLVLGWEYAPTWGSYFMVRSGELTIPRSLSEFALDRIDFEYDEVARGIQADIFPPHPGPMCTSCGVRRFCYEFQGDLAHEVLPWEKPRTTD